MAVVYRAEHVESHQPAAVKTVSVANPHRLASIRREIQALTRIRHPGVIRIVGHGIEDGRPWYAMDLIDGENLGAFLARRWSQVRPQLGRSKTDTSVGREIAAEGPQGPQGRGTPFDVDRLLPVTAVGLPETLQIFSSLCDTLAFLHGEGIINCDLKPENVLLLPPRLEPVIIDFGLASTFGAADGREALQSARGIEGTVAYMAPEQIRNEFLDARADLYSVGCMLYEAVTGGVPFTGTHGQVLHQHLSAAPRAPSEFVRDLPPALEDLILGLLKKPLHERVGYAGDVAQALREIAGEQTGRLRSPAARPYLYRPRFSGRREPLAQVSSHVERARGPEGRGALVLVAGESGVGKTRFAMEVTHSSRQSNLRIVTGQCSTPSSSSTGAVTSAPLYPVRPLLQAIADRCQQEGRELADRIVGERGPLLSKYEVALAQLPGQSEQPVGAPLPSDAGARRVVSSLMETIAAFATDRPLLLILDDLQWADELTMAFLRSLSADYLGKTPVVVLGTYRTEETTPELRALAREDHVVQVALERLDRDAVEAMVRDMLATHQRPPARLVDFLTKQSEGNPFFVAEYLRAAMASRSIERHARGSWRLVDSEDGYERLPLPGSLRELITSRLQGLPPGTAAVLEAAAVIGRDIDEPMLLAAAGVSDATGDAFLDELVNRQILEPAPDGALRFVHDKLREVAYDAIEPQRRVLLHRSAATVIEGARRDKPDFEVWWPRLGHHFLAGGAAGRAAYYLGRAADYARAMYANDESVALYRAAIAASDTAVASAENEPLLPAPGRLHESLADILALTTRREEARGAYDEALRRTPATDPVARARLLRKLGKTWETEHRHDEALRQYGLARATLSTASSKGSPEHRAEWIQVHVEELWVCYWLNRVSEMNALVDLLRPLIESHGAPLQRARFFECQMLLSFRRDRYLVTEQTLAFAKAAVEACRQGNELSELRGAQVIYGLALLVYGSFDEADAELEPILAFAQRAGDNLVQARCATYLTLAARMRGRLAETRDYARRTAEAAGTSGMLEYLAAARANEAWLALREGDLDGTIAQGEDAISIWKDRVFPFQWMALLPLLEARLARNELPEAIACAQALLAPTQQYLPGAAADALARAIRAATGGNHDGARSSLLLALRALERTGYR